MRKALWLLVVFALWPSFASAQKGGHVRGYTTKKGTVVAPYNRSSPNHTKADNYSTKGNVNPYTGKAGTKSAAPSITVPPVTAAPLATVAPSRTTSLPPSMRAPSRRPTPKVAAAAPANASAQCADGSYSFSAHRRGTCSHHGGVSSWLKDIP